MSLYVCHTECFFLNYLWQLGDLAECAELPNHHFCPFDGLEGFFTLSGRKFLIEKNEVTGKLEISGVCE